MQIVSMEELANTAKIENLCASTQEPVFVTKDGRTKLVVMDMACFERLIDQSREARTINEGLADLEAGRVVDGKNVLGEMRRKYFS